MTKTLLIYPPTDSYRKTDLSIIPKYFHKDLRYPWMPYQLLSIGACLAEQGEEADILDLCAPRTLKNYNTTNICNIIKKYDPDILGFTTFNANIEQALEVARAYKQVNPAVVIVFGGSQADFMPTEALNEMPSVNVIVRGEGEQTMAEISTGKKFPEIKGIVYRDAKGVHENEIRPLIDNVDIYPSPYANGFIDGLKLFKIKDYPYATLVASRGCPHICDYCVQGAMSRTWGSKIRVHNVERIIEDIRVINEKYGIKKISFFDNDFLVHKNSYRIVDRIIEEKLETELFFLTRLDRISRQVAKKLQKVNTTKINLGIDSLNEGTLLRYHRSVDYENYVAGIRNGIKNATDYGITPIINIIIGLPCESKEEIQHTINLCKEITTKVPKEFYIPLYEPFFGTIVDRENLIPREKTPLWKSMTKFDTKWLTHEEKMELWKKIAYYIVSCGKKYNMFLSAVSAFDIYVNFGEEIPLPA